MPNTDPKLINPDLYRFSQELIKELKISGKDFRIFEGFRSFSDQEKLFKDKKTTVKPGQSKHNKNPSEAVTIYEYQNNKPIFTGFITTQQFKNIVNNLTLKYKGVVWGGNFKSPILGHFEIMPTVKSAVEINPAPIPPAQIKPIFIPPIKPVTQIEPVKKPTNLIQEQKPVIILPKPAPAAITPAKLIPASVKVEVDNSTIIIAALAAGLFFWMRK